MKITNVTILTATDGHMLTNGETYGKSVSLGKNDSVDNWREVPFAEYEEWKKQQELVGVEQ